MEAFLEFFEPFRWLIFLYLLVLIIAIPIGIIIILIYPPASMVFVFMARLRKFWKNGSCNGIEEMSSELYKFQEMRRIGRKKRSNDRLEQSPSTKKTDDEAN